MTASEMTLAKPLDGLPLASPPGTDAASYMKPLLRLQPHAIRDAAPATKAQPQPGHMQHFTSNATHNASAIFDLCPTAMLFVDPKEYQP